MVIPTRSLSSTSWPKACARRCSSKRRLASAQSSSWKSLKRGMPPPTSMTSPTLKISSCSNSAGSISFSSAFSASFSFSSPLPSSSMGTGSPSFASFFSSSGFLVAASFSFASSFFSAFSFFSASFFAAAAFAAATFAAATFFSASFLAARCAHAAFQATCLARQRCSVFCHLARCCFAQSDGTIPSTRRALFLLRTHAFTYSCAFWALLHSYLISSKPSSFSGRLNSPRDSLSF
mmetsp:Transcript_9827/g.29420  ORF Transcript_9827/g.29420 Transcript_9827/m.29420 type:complete len:235 (-) Transcript_9827:166-870(-)